MAVGGYSVSIDSTFRAEPLLVGDLFSGIGGFSLGLERAGMKVRWQVEIDEWCRKVLAKHWPEVKRYGDIKGIKTDELERVDLICGGFPCQPVSHAGKRKGQSDDRWLWPEFFRVVRGLRPRWVLLENVVGLLSANSGSAFSEVVGDLASLGYDIEWDCIPAVAIGAPHRRDRVWIVAHSDGIRRSESIEETNGHKARHGIEGSGVLADTNSDGRQGTGVQQKEWDPLSASSRSCGCRGKHARGCGESETEDVSNTDGQRYERREQLQEITPRLMANTDSERRPQSSGSVESMGPEQRVSTGKGPEIFGKPFPRDNTTWVAPSGLLRVSYGISNRLERIRGLGNAVVPQVVEAIGRRILNV